ncbi:MAG: DUF1631 family protein, partial [Betaproteobacteria bacterium]|nr:DUF1631 family protein [Betaproteobacteria bacterium]
MREPQRLLSGVKETARSALAHAASELIGATAAAVDEQLTRPDIDNARALVAAQRELKVYRAAWEQALQQAFQRGLAGVSTRTSVRPEELAILGAEEVEAQLLLTRTAHQIAQALQWELPDLNARISYLHNAQGVDAQLNPVNPEMLAHAALDALTGSGLSADTQLQLRPLFLQEFGVFATHLYHELNAWMVREGVLPKIDLRSLVVRSRSSDRWQQITAQSLVDWQQPPIESQPGASGFGTGPRTGRSSGWPGASDFAHTSPFAGSDLMTLREGPTTTGHTPLPFSTSGGGLWTRVRRTFTDRFLPVAGRSDESQPTHPEFTLSLGEVLERIQTQVQTRFQSTLPQINSDQLALLAQAAASMPRLVQFRTELQAAAATAGERATVEIVALMFEHILSDESIPASARILFARLQIPVLRVAVRESDTFLEATHPARDFIDRLGSVVMGYAGEMKVDEKLLAEMRRLVMAAENSKDLSGIFFARLLHDFEHFLDLYGRELREISVVGVPLLEQTEDHKVSAVLFTIELRKLLDDVPCDRRLRDFLLHSWVSLLSAVAARSGKDSEEVKSYLRLAADLVWCGVPKVAASERAEAVSQLPDMMRRVEYALASAGADSDTQKRVSTRLRSLLLQIVRTPANSAPDLVFDALIAKLQEMESAIEQAHESSVNYRVPLAALRSQIAARAMALQVVEPADLGMPDDAVASSRVKAWAMALPVGAWYRFELQGRPQLLQLAWVSPKKNYLLFSDQLGTAGLISEPNTVALLSQQGAFKPMEYESLTDRATR